VVFPTFNERTSVAQAAVGAVRESHEPRQGYGSAIRRGLHESTGDLMVISEPDGTFLGRDTFKLLAYVGDFDVVYGSLTAHLLISRGAKMGALVR
jgi:hypothetical protein